MIPMVESYLDTAKTAHLGGEITGLASPSLERAFSGAVVSIIRGWGVAQTDLNRLLRQRIGDFVRNLRMSLTLLGGFVGFSILLTIMTHRHIVASLQHLEGVVAKVREVEDLQRC